MTDIWTSTLRVGSTVDRNRNENAPADENPFNTPDGKSTFRMRQNQYLWQNDLQFTQDQKVTLAHEHVDQRCRGRHRRFQHLPRHLRRTTRARAAT